MSDINEHISRVEKILEYYFDKLNEWELSFIESLQSQLYKYRSLSEKQIDKLNQINRRLTR